MSYLYISELQEATEWVDKHLNFDINRDVNLFEVTIRVLGSLLSIYHFTKDEMFIRKAVSNTSKLLYLFKGAFLLELANGGVHIGASSTASIRATINDLYIFFGFIAAYLVSS